MIPNLDLKLWDGEANAEQKNYVQILGRRDY